MMKLACLRWMTLVLSAGIAVFCAAVLLANTEPGEPESPQAVREATEAAMKVADERDRLGQALMAGLSDMTRSLRERRACALTLGELRYLPAIPKLIEHIDLYYGGDWSSHLVAEIPHPLDSGPCTRALVDYGEAAIPAVVEAYLKETNPRREGRLWFALRYDKTKAAKIYVQGLLLESQDQAAKEKLLELARGLEKPD